MNIEPIYKGFMIPFFLDFLNDNSRLSNDTGFGKL